MTDQKLCRCTVWFENDGEPLISRNECPVHEGNDPIRIGDAVRLTVTDTQIPA